MLSIEERLIAGRYRVQRKIGAGALSIVYLAHDERLRDKPVAFKLLRGSEPDPLVFEVFRREIASLERLEHPNIVSILDHGLLPDTKEPFVVLEYLPVSLRDEQARRTRQGDRDWYLDVMHALSDALTHAHLENVIHRDIKSANVRVDTSGTVKITDFGVSFLKHQLSVGQTVGHLWSPGYASPEQRRGEPVDERTDIYSLGVLFCELITGDPPRSEPIPGHDPTASLSCPKGVQQIVSKMIEPAKEDRWESADQIKHAVETALVQFRDVPQIPIVVTKRALDQLRRRGVLANQVLDDGAKEWFQDELGGLSLEPLPAWLDNRNLDPQPTIIALGSRSPVRFILKVEDQSPRLALVDVQFAYAPQLDASRSTAARIRYDWIPVDRSERLFPNEKLQYQRNIEALIHELKRHETRHTAARQASAERADLVESWEKILNHQRREILDATETLDYINYSEDEYLIRLGLRQSAHQRGLIREGAPVAVSSGADRSRPIGIGRVVEITDQAVLIEKDSLSGTRNVSFRDQEIPRSGRLSLDVGEQIRSIERQLKALRRLRDGATRNPRLPEILSDLSVASMDESWANPGFRTPNLDANKREMIERALATRDLFILRGPPGTGKTTVIAELLVQILQNGMTAGAIPRVLITSQSNVPVDHVLHRVSEIIGNDGFEAVRLGRNEKISDAGRPWTLRRRRHAWASNIRERCAIVLAELGTSHDTVHLQKDAEACGDWLNEAAMLATEVRRGEVELGSLQELVREARSNTVWGSSSQILEAEIAVQEAALEDLRSQVREHLDVVRSLLEVTYDIPSDTSTSDEIEQLRSELVEYQERATPTNDPKRKLRRVIREWIEVVESADDIDATILDRSYALAATCMYAGNRQMEDMTYDWVIVDEAGRATLPELLIPLVRGQRIVLIGDERQLPPMASDPPSDEWFNSNGLDRDIVTTSYFEELLIRGEVEHPELVGMLDVQHRMHPGIGELISNVFYESRLKHGVSSSERQHGFHWIPRPVMWYSTEAIPSHFESRRGTSFVNLSEVEIVASLLEQMEQSCLLSGAGAEVGIISGYAAQVDELSGRVRPGDRARWKALSIEIATVDAFQGRDSDIIIYSAVRSNSDGQVGFLAQKQRLNVAMSRARKLLIVVGDATMLERARTTDGNPFADIIGHIRSHPEACQLVTWHGSTGL